MVQGRGDDSFIEGGVGQDIDQEDLSLGGGKAEKWMGISLAGVFRIEGIVRWREHAYWNTLYPLPAGVLHTAIGLLPHVLPIGGGVL